jgi:hypothetical protein
LQHGDAGSGDVEGIDYDILELIAQKLFDGGFVALLHLDVIGENADGAKTAFWRGTVGGEKFLNGFGGVLAIV